MFVSDEAEIEERKPISLKPWGSHWRGGSSHAGRLQILGGLPRNG
jgi:hypothetical protein